MGDINNKDNDYCNEILYIAGLIIVIFIMGILVRKCEDPVIYNEGKSPTNYACDSLRNDSSETDSICRVPPCKFRHSSNAESEDLEDRVKKHIDRIDTHVTMWLSIVAAICTILPVAMSIRHSRELEREMQNYQKEIDNKNNELKDLADKINALNNNLSSYKTIHDINNALQTLKVLRDYTNKYRVLKDERQILEQLVKSIKLSLEDYSKVIEKEDSQHLATTMINIVETVRSLIYAYEPLAVHNSPALFSFQQSKDELIRLSETINNDSNNVHKYWKGVTISVKHVLDMIESLSQKETTT